MSRELTPEDQAVIDAAETWNSSCKMRGAGHSHSITYAADLADALNARRAALTPPPPERRRWTVTTELRPPKEGDLVVGEEGIFESCSDWIANAPVIVSVEPQS